MGVRDGVENAKETNIGSTSSRPYYQWALNHYYTVLNYTILYCTVL